MVMAACAPLAQLRTASGPASTSGRCAHSGLSTCYARPLSRSCGTHMQGILCSRWAHGMSSRADRAAARMCAFHGYPELTAPVAFVPAMCFDQACQAAADQTALTTFAVPVFLAVAGILYLLRRVPQQAFVDGKAFEDEETGVVFLSDGTAPQRDKDGQLVFKPISYTPWPVRSDEAGEVVRVPVGPARDRKPRSFLFARTLPGVSTILTVTLPRPLGVVLEYDERSRRAVVVDTVPGTAADQQRRRASLSSARGASTRPADGLSVQPGDVLRGVTCTNFVYPTRALFGAVPPERHIVVYGADKQTWTSIRGALKKGDFKDGDVTLILERGAQTDS